MTAKGSSACQLAARQTGKSVIMSRNQQLSNLTAATSLYIYFSIGGKKERERKKNLTVLISCKFRAHFAMPAFLTGIVSVS